MPGTEPAQPPDLHRALEKSLTSHFARPCRIAALHRRPYVYSTSFLLEELDVELEDGTCLHLLFKDLSRSGLLEGARVTKPDFLYDPLREIESYQSILGSETMGTAVCYGAVASAGRYWLFLEKVAGHELYQEGDLAVWADVARWLAGMHDRFSDRSEELRHTHVHLLHYDGAYYRRWLDRTQQGTGWGDAAEGAAALRRVASALDAALERLGTMPVTFVHGELYASNVLVADTPAGRRVCPVDWEMAGLGPGLLDLAALCTGWDNGSRRVIALSYHAALERRHGWPLGEGDFMTLLDYCSLYLDVQWLGWSPRWSPPPEHARDWLGHALQLIDRLGL